MKFVQRAKGLKHQKINTALDQSLDLLSTVELLVEADALLVEVGALGD